MLVRKDKIVRLLLVIILLKYLVRLPIQDVQFWTMFTHVLVSIPILIQRKNVNPMLVLILSLELQIMEYVSMLCHAV